MRRLILFKKGEISLSAKFPLFPKRPALPQAKGPAIPSEIELIDGILGKDQRLAINDFAILPDRILPGFTGLESDTRFNFKFTCELEMGHVGRNIAKLIRIP